MVLRAETAAELMTPNPLSIRAEATLKEATAFLTDKGFSGVPVIDKAGRPVGVLSQSDIVVHERERVDYLSPALADSEKAVADRFAERGFPREGFQVECVDPTQVAELMTPVVFSVTPETPTSEVIDEMLAHNVHRLFVVDRSGVMVGVISTFDVLRHLRGGASPVKPSSW
jgi:CBS domain-containing protein